MAKSKQQRQRHIFRQRRMRRVKRQKLARKMAGTTSQAPSA